MNLSLTIGSTRSGSPVRWSAAGNPHISVSGRSGSGKSYFLRGMVEQAVRQGATCLVLDSSSDFCEYVPPPGVSFRRIGVTSPSFSINPLSGPENPQIRAQRLLSTLSTAIRMGNRAKLALQKAAADYLKTAPVPTLGGLLSVMESTEDGGNGLKQAQEPLALLDGLVHCGRETLSLDLSKPGITAVDFNEIFDPRMRAMLVDLVLSCVWNMWTASPYRHERYLICVLDECQQLNWTSGMPIRILREGRKFNFAGWFSTQYIDKPNAVAALGQASLQAHFHPDEANAAKLAKTLAQSGTGTPDQWLRVIRSLRTGQFLCRRPDGQILAVTVPRRESAPPAFS